MSKSNNVYVGFLSEVKEYILVIAMVLGASGYLSHYVNEISEGAEYLKWIIYSLLFIIIISLYFFTLRPVLLKKRELNLRPRGQPDENYFTTSPRVDDSYHFFISGYEQYLEWLKSPRSPILYLTGSSGSGKSSLIHAYLAPQLEKTNLPKTNVYVLRSYHDPLKALYEALKMDDKADVKINEEAIFTAINKASEMLSPKEQILIVLDQFEEFFFIA